jgi:hypothetical protein
VNYLRPFPRREQRSVEPCTAKNFIIWKKTMTEACEGRMKRKRILNE